MVDGYDEIINWFNFRSRALFGKNMEELDSLEELNQIKDEHEASLNPNHFGQVQFFERIWDAPGDIQQFPPGDLIPELRQIYDSFIVPDEIGEIRNEEIALGLDPTPLKQLDSRREREQARQRIGRREEEIGSQRASSVRIENTEKNITSRKKIARTARDIEPIIEEYDELKLEAKKFDEIEQKYNFTKLIIDQKIKGLEKLRNKRINTKTQREETFRIIDELVELDNEASKIPDFEKRQELRSSITRRIKAAEDWEKRQEQKKNL